MAPPGTVDTASGTILGGPPPTLLDPGAAPTPLPDQGTGPLAVTTAISTGLDGSNGLAAGGLGLGGDGGGAATTTGATGDAAPTDAPQGMDPMAERAMISVGSIGMSPRLLLLRGRILTTLPAAFVMIFSICWMIYRRMKKNKKGGRKSAFSFRSLFPKRIAFRIPVKFKSNDRAWENLGDSSSVKDRPPTYTSGKAAGKKSLPLGGFYGHEKAYPYHPEDGNQEKKEKQPQLPRLQTTGIPTAPQMPTHTPSSPRPLSSHPVSALSSNPVSAAKSNRGDVSANTSSPSTVILFSHQTQESFSSTDAAQFGTMTIGSGASTLRSKMGPVYYNQSEYARTPSAAYDPARRQVHRASELSSLSSGFGDGDIIVGAPPVPVPQIPANVYSGTPAVPVLAGGLAPAPAPGPGNYNNRFSWMSQEPSKRDTIYTQTSEDMPPRFRTVNSWVDQQTGRIKRAQQREQDQPPVPQVPGVAGIPGIHNPPNEQGFEMMMDDEKPRRVEDTIPAKT